jgi:hypothetical protein
MNHLNATQLEDIIDGMKDAEIDLHIRTCQECRSKLRALQQLDRALEQLPLERTSDDFTGRVMRQLGIKESPSFACLVLKNLAPLVALLIIAGVIVSVMNVSGVSQSPSVRQGVEATQSVYNGVGSGLAIGVTEVNGWMGKYLSFGITKSSYGLVVFLVLFFGTIALLDRYFFMPMFRKKRSAVRM